MGLTMREFTVKEKLNLKDFTDAVYPQGSFCYARLLKDRDIKVNGKRVDKNVKLEIGDIVAYYTTKKQEELKSHLIAYEDDNVYVADKLSGVSFEGLYSEISAHMQLFAIHRLDRNTQGLIIFAKTRPAEQELLSAFKQHKINKTYFALCKNNFKEDKKLLRAYLKKDEKVSLVKVFQNPRQGAEEIVTQYEVLQKLSDVALVKIELHTGRTHQIRAHMAFIGCPVLGDGKYGDSALNKKYGLKRQCLVAKYLSFELSGSLAYLNDIKIQSAFEPSIKN